MEFGVRYGARKVGNGEAIWTYIRKGEIMSVSQFWFLDNEGGTKDERADRLEEKKEKWKLRGNESQIDAVVKLNALRAEAKQGGEEIRRARPT